MRVWHKIWELAGSLWPIARRKPFEEQSRMASDELKKLLERLRAEPSTVRDIPDAARLLKAALPIYFQQKNSPDHPGIWGTCSAVRYRGFTCFLTAKHVLQGVDSMADELTILVPLEFRRGQVNCAKIKSIFSSEPTEEQYREASDVAVMVPTTEPQFIDGASRAIELDRVVDLQSSPIGQIMVVAGYPIEDPGNYIDYETKQINFKLFHAVGTYGGKAPEFGPGCHKMQVSTKDVGGPQGMSGSPVLGLVEKDSRLSVSFAGLVIRGDEKLVVFIEAAYLVKVLHTDGGGRELGSGRGAKS
jgi:hypothetical protein